MIKRIWSNLRDGIPPEPSVRFEQRFELGSAGFFLPYGWTAVRKSEEVWVARTSDDLQQATISLMRFESEPTFEAFRLLCDKRLGAEKRALGNGILKSDSPSSDKRGFSMFFFGEDEEKQRLFSCYFLLAKAELFTIYVEGIGVATTEHVDSFGAFLGRFKTK